MSILFKLGHLNGLLLKNRFVRSATWEGMASPDGSVTPRLTDTMTDLARGGVGLIVSGHAYVRADGQAGPWQLGLHRDDLVPGLREMTAAVHAAGGVIAAQLAHAGQMADPALTGHPPLAVSAPGEPDSPAREATPADIDELAAAFASAARRARRAGFDGVQLHSAHGYLLSQFLSPLYNRRQDRYGGDIDNRCRAHREVLRAVREAVGPDYPVMIKINCSDFAPGGLTLEEGLAAGRSLAAAGIDAIEISGGLSRSDALSPIRKGIVRPDQEAYFRAAAAAFKQAVDTPLMLVGGVRSFDVAESLLETGTADYIALCRPLIAEPDLVTRWQEGDRRPSLCHSDNLCFQPARKGEGIACVTLARARRQSP